MIKKGNKSTISSEKSFTISNKISIDGVRVDTVVAAREISDKDKNVTVNLMGSTLPNIFDKNRQIDSQKTKKPRVPKEPDLGFC